MPCTFPGAQVRRNRCFYRFISGILSTPGIWPEGRLYVQRGVYALLLAVYATTGCCYAQEEKKQPEPPVQVPADSSAEYTPSEWIVLPQFAYAPETGFQYGIFGQFLYRPAPEAHINTVMVGASHTTQKQTEAFLLWDWFLDQERWRIDGNLVYSLWPNEFYGIGTRTSEDDKEAYTEEKLSLNLGIQRRVFAEPLRLGVYYRFRPADIVERESGGSLASGLIPGSRKSQASGLGFISTWDSRDNVFYPTEGIYYIAKFLVYSPTLGSDYTFREYSLDIRHYFPVDSSSVFAVQAYVELLSGGPPFQMMPKLGGAYTMRGYFEGRFRDKALWNLQAEYRFDVFWRFGAVVFGSIGDVAPALDAFAPRHIKYAIGAGIRYKLLDFGLRVRLDFGYSAEGFGGPYITGLEAY